MRRRRRESTEVSKSPLPVVLLHGCGGSAASTYIENGWVSALTDAGRDAVPITLPGHSGDASHDPCAYDDLAGTVLSRLPDRFDAVGFSLGGKLLLEIAARAPGRGGRLVVGGVGNNAFAPERSGEASAVALETGIGDATPPALRGFYRYCETSGTDLLAIAAVLRRAPNPILDADRLHRIVARVLLVVGDADPIAMPTNELIAAIPTVSAITIPGVDHLALPADRDFQRHALTFLAAL